MLPMRGANSDSVSPSIENGSTAEQDDDDLTKVATGAARRTKKRAADLLENIICQRRFE